jgi:hypothetical protein
MTESGGGLEVSEVSAGGEFDMSAMSGMMNAQPIGAITQMSDSVREPAPLFRLPA